MKLRLLLTLATAAIPAIVGCAGCGHEPISRQPVVDSIATVTPPTPPDSPREEFGDNESGIESGIESGGGAATEKIPSAELAVDTISAELPEGTGIALAPVGDSIQNANAGSVVVGPAWSTLKVPMAIAVEAAELLGSGPVRAAITESDNAAAEAMWESLGTPDQAAAAIENQLSVGRSSDTVVPQIRLRPGFSVFGQTQWGLKDQATYAATIACLPEAAHVVELMGEVVASQRWGLGQIPGARFKGGWGPSERGDYLVRQFGIISSPEGSTAVAVAARAPTFDEGVVKIGAIAKAIQRNLGILPTGICN